MVSWWWSKNNCTIATHDSRKKNYFCLWREPKGSASICLPYGRLSLLFIVSSIVSHSTFCSSHLLFCPLAGSWQLWVSRALGSPLKQPYIECQQVSLSTWEWEARRILFSQGANDMLNRAERVQSTLTVLVWSWLSSFRKAVTSASPCTEPCDMRRKGNDKATKEQAYGQGTNSGQNWKYMSVGGSQ